MSRPNESFIDEMKSLEPAYLERNGPIERSGFGGGSRRWEAERRPLTGGIDQSGSFLDVGCAVGWLAACVVKWCGEDGYEIEPFGVDIGPRLIEEACINNPHHADNFWAGDIWEWAPPRRFDFVYSIFHLAPPDLAGELVQRLASWVEPGGRLIMGYYGSKSRGIAPLEVAPMLEQSGLRVAGSSSGGDGPITRFAWADV